jgi:hypothetical protein
MWTKYDYVCTNCDALIEVTALEIPRIDPDCICGNGMIIGIGKYPAFQPETNVTEVTPAGLVRINTNPYN